MFEGIKEGDLVLLQCEGLLPMHVLVTRVARTRFWAGGGWWLLATGNPYPRWGLRRYWKAARIVTEDDIRDLMDRIERGDYEAERQAMRARLRAAGFGAFPELDVIFPKEAQARLKAAWLDAFPEARSFLQSGTVDALLKAEDLTRRTDGSTISEVSDVQAEDPDHNDRIEPGEVGDLPGLDYLKLEVTP